MALGVSRGREVGVHCNSEGVLEHGGDDSGEQGTAQFKARVGVDFDEPRLHFFVNHEVVTENLK